MATRTYTLTLQVTAPATTGESDIEHALNAALNEPPCDWGTWTVGFVQVSRVEVDPDPDDETAEAPTGQ